MTERPEFYVAALPNLIQGAFKKTGVPKLASVTTLENPKSGESLKNPDSHSLLDKASDQSEGKAGE